MYPLRFSRVFVVSATVKTLYAPVVPDALAAALLAPSAKAPRTRARGRHWVEAVGIVTPSTALDRAEGRAR